MKEKIKTILIIVSRILFSIFVVPIIRLVNLITRHKDNLLEWHLNFGPSFVKIQTYYKEQSLQDDLLIAGYILFLARYFYICDDRQIKIVRDLLLDAVEKAEKPNAIAPKLYEVIFQTLNKMEQGATIGLFEIYNKFLPIPPLTYSESEEPRHSFAKYSFFIFERPSDRMLTSIFHMSAGPDIILLPITIGILYEYVVNKIQDKEKKNKLNQSIIDLLKEYEFIDCRSPYGFVVLPIGILAKNGLKFSGEVEPEKPENPPKNFKFSKKQIEEIKKSIKDK
ncbi:MAG: hypothetical protein NTV77_01885 [Candidatus Azambacteria bacterium]|nr:hypothetical protein [Candidatus Azambacteria bacterium]